MSPKNLVVTEDGITKVLDFGIARSALASVTVADVVKGTPGYLSPEQAMGRPLSARTDVFSLGAVFVELLTREPLFRGSDARATMQAVLDAPIPPLEGVPASIRDVVGWMLVRDPAHRTIEMDQVADALDAAAVGYGGGHRDLVTFLSAECGALLEHRRRRVAELVRGEHRAPKGELPRDETSTMIMLESALELDTLPSGSISEEHPVIGSDSDDTLLDDGATEIDLPD